MRSTLIFFVLFITGNAFSQSAAVAEYNINEAFKQEIDSYLSFTIPTITCEELADGKQEYLILDAREKKEYKTSHIPNAQYIGYSDLDFKVLEGCEKDEKIVLYCSIGYRSEKIGEQLKELGYTNVYNLYGSIFEWSNQNMPLVKNDSIPTKEIHTFNKKWSQWVSNPDLKKIH